MTPASDDLSRRWVSQVFINDNKPLQRIGPDPIYRNEEYLQLATVGRDPDDVIPNSFFFDPADRILYIKISGEPAWFSIGVGVRGFALTAVRTLLPPISHAGCRRFEWPAPMGRPAESAKGD